MKGRLFLISMSMLLSVCQSDAASVRDAMQEDYFSTGETLTALQTNRTAASMRLLAMSEAFEVENRILKAIGTDQLFCIPEGVQMSREGVAAIFETTARSKPYPDTNNFADAAVLARHCPMHGPVRSNDADPAHNRLSAKAFRL